MKIKHLDGTTEYFSDIEGLCVKDGKLTFYTGRSCAGASEPRKQHGYSLANIISWED